MKSLALLAISAVSAMAYVHFENGSSFERRVDNTNIQFTLNSAAVAGLTNVSGKLWIAAGSDIPGAAAAALNTWNQVATANVHFAPLQISPIVESAAGQNVIAFDDTVENREILGSALAVTIRYPDADNSGNLEKTDILFSPLQVFSTNLVAGSYDFQSVLTHELGHSLGADHTGALSATMFQASLPVNTNETVLSQDDLAFVTETYPAQNSYGSLAGTVQDGAGNPLRGALITAQDPVTGVLVGSFSNFTDGSFYFMAPPGNYQLWAEPLTGLVAAANLYLPKTQIIDTAFQIGAPSSPVQVAPGVTTQAQIVAAAGVSPIQIKYAGAVPSASTGGFEIYAGPAAIPSGQQVIFVFEATGLGTDLSDSNISLVGPITLVPGSVAAFGHSQYQMTLNVPATSTVTTGSLIINYQGNTTAYSGGFLIQPVPPQFTGPGLGNVFNYASGAVAPGEIVAIFGTNVGPATGASGVLNSAGSLDTMLSEIQVRFDGVLAPIFFASTGQINVEVPYEVAGKSSTTIIVSSGVSASAPITLPVQSGVPGLFTAALNPDGSINTQANPAPAGQYLSLFATGLGALADVATGQVVGGAVSAPGTTLTVDGVSTIPSYAGAAPGFTGLDQVNVVGLTSGQHSLSVVAANGIASQAIPVWVR